MSLAQSLNQYHSPGNRFSYYPLSSKWEEIKGEVPKLPDPSQTGYGLYIHIPFCREICTYCGCNIKISKKAEEHKRYIESLIKELDLKTKNWPKDLPLINITFGGGTPNTMDTQAVDLLWDALKGRVTKNTGSGQMEADPRYFTNEQAKRALELKIDRISFGVQDFIPEILSNVNRRQTPEDILRAKNSLDPEQSFGIDLLWGLPKQNVDSISQWEAYLRELTPDWISFYPLAKVPWLESIQHAYGDFTLPTRQEKYELYQAGVEIFDRLGYKNLGMGHFIRINGKLDTDQKIYRKVSGLFTQETPYLLGLGVSAISESSEFLAQNDKIIDRYMNTLDHKSVVPVIKYHQKSSKEKLMNEFIEDLFTNNRISPQLYSEMEGKIPNLWHKDGKISSFGQHFKKNIMQMGEKLLF